MVDSFSLTGTASSGDILRRLAAEVSMTNCQRVDQSITIKNSGFTQNSPWDAYNRAKTTQNRTLWMRIGFLECLSHVLPKLESSISRLVFM